MLCKKNIFLLEVDTLVQSKNAFPLTSYVKENFTILLVLVLNNAILLSIASCIIYIKIHKRNGLLSSIYEDFMTGLSLLIICMQQQS